MQIHEEWPEANLRIESDLRGVAESDDSEPRRCVCVGKSFGGYEPTGMLRRLTEPIIGKAKKRQAGKKGHATRVLACDVSQTIVAVHLAEEVRREGYAAVLSDELGPLIGEDYDVIALCRHHGWTRGWKADWVIRDSTEHEAVAEALFGPFGDRRDTPDSAAP